jgi:multidrug efflux pump subunit AcrA (membrane-fusion protein)
MTDETEAEPTPRAKSALGQFDELFLESDTVVATEPEQSFKDRAIGEVVNPLEQIDSVFKRTGSRIWLGVGGIFLLVVALVVWSFVAQRVVTTNAQVIILPKSGLYPVATLQTGVIGDVLVKEEQSVIAGQTLTTVSIPGIGEFPITAPIDGTVVAVDAAKGQLTGPGTTLFLLAPKGEFVLAIGLVGPAQLSGLQVGQKATIAIPTVNPQRYGRMIGTLVYVGSTPATRSRISSVLGGDAQATAILQQGPAYEIQIQLKTDDTPSGYDWTVGEGPPTPLPLETTGVAFIQTSKKTIASKVFG